MAANYGFQILNGNFAAAIDDYELKLRFMNDLATYRIDVSWLWTLLHHRPSSRRRRYLRKPALTADGVRPAVKADASSPGCASRRTCSGGCSIATTSGRARSSPRWIAVAIPGDSTAPRQA